MIHVCFGLYDKTGRYSKFTGTTIVSMFENATAPPPSITVHILHDNTLSDDNRDKFNRVAGRYGQIIRFYNVEKTCADKIAEIKNTVSNKFKAEYSVAAMYRFLIPQLLPEVDKVIYLDSDIIVRLDIAELWRVKLGDNPIGAVPAVNQKSDVNFLKENFPLIGGGIVKLEDYFNSGVLLMNLKFFRDEMAIIMDGMKFIAEHPAYQFFDQDVLNYCFATRYLKLPAKFNRATRWARYNEEPLSDMIYHYVGQNPLWSFSLETDDEFNRLWIDYFVKTPWFDAATIDHFYESIRRMHIDLKRNMIQLSATMSGKVRAFVTTKQNIIPTKETFIVRDDEEIITVSRKDAVPKVLNAMKRARGKKVFFVLMPGFPFQALAQAGFVPGKDFLDGLEFFSEVQDMPLNSHLLLKAL